MSSAGSEAVALVSSVLVSSCGSAGSSLASAGAVGAEVFSTGGKNIKTKQVKHRCFCCPSVSLYSESIVETLEICQGLLVSNPIKADLKVGFSKFRQRFCE